MEVCNNIVDKIVKSVINSNQTKWFLNIKNLGGFINNMNNPKLHALHNHINPEISNCTFIICCYHAEILIKDKYKFDIESLEIII
tara:strand:+ start:270 stop:524 length:255 start_codon:yes stop_codon:yes gene_type:complete